ncbi:N-acetyltransferase [Pseudomonas sp. LP_7_YM]|uniref:GNAT family N-acetyltransferase n=1 Tax=Pseudomonas sp. LP_7_YM TaxID=2485137 RepID=UPI00105E6D57|nr:GNAT family N-acetyltransferase [Pseudomonas sp. LP_7_YM]
MKSSLMKYQALSALQREQVEQIELQPWQKVVAGDIHGALHSLTARPLADIQGYVLLIDDVPRGFFLLKRRVLLPLWAQEAPGTTATLHALIIDQRYQRRGLGEACLRQLPEQVLQLWPDIEQLMLAVHPTNQVARALYLSLGWREDGNATRTADGYETRMTRRLR